MFKGSAEANLIITMSFYKWEKKVSLFRNKFIIRESAIAIGIPFAFLLAFVIYVSDGDIMGSDARYAIGLVTILFALTALLLLVVYKGKYAPVYIVDSDGVINYTSRKQVGKNRVINILALLLGLFRGNFTVSGAGLLSYSRQVVKIRWKDVTRVRYYPKDKAVLIKGGFADKIVVFCTPENYEEVSHFIFKCTMKNKKKGR